MLNIDIITNNDGGDDYIFTQMKLILIDDEEEFMKEVDDYTANYDGDDETIHRLTNVQFANHFEQDFNLIQRLLTKLYLVEVYVKGDTNITRLIFTHDNVSIDLTHKAKLIIVDEQ